MYVRTGRRWLRLLPVAVGLATVVAASGAASAAVPPEPAAPATLARPAADHPELLGARAPIRGEVPGLTGEAANRAAGEAATRFKELTLQRTSAALDDLHVAYGTGFQQPQAKGIRATHSVLTGAGTTTRGNEYIYAPTSQSAGGACMEITTAYTPSGPLVWAWDWCGGNAGVGKSVAINSAFLSTYTTTVNGLPAYSFEVSQTNAATNGWTAYLYNFQTHAYETFYTSSGTYDLSDPGFGWNVFEIYSSIEPSTGVGYYCTDMRGQAFDASGIEANLGGTWAPATPANSFNYGNASGNFQCPSLALTMNTPNTRWSARIGG